MKITKPVAVTAMFITVYLWRKYVLNVLFMLSRVEPTKTSKGVLVMSNDDHVSDDKSSCFN